MGMQLEHVSTSHCKLMIKSAVGRSCVLLLSLTLMVEKCDVETALQHKLLAASLLILHGAGH